MFQYDNSNFPLVKVKLIGDLDNDDEFTHFLDEWLRLYDNQNDFTFLFDTLEVGNPPLKYCIKMAGFIKDLRKRDYQYLQESIILINNNKIKWMLEFIFSIAPPVARVYIFNVNDDPTINKNVLNDIKNSSSTVIVEPGKPLLPIF